MTHHVLRPPITEEQVRALRVNDTVTLEGALYGIRDANLIALFDKGRKTRFDMQGQAAIHTAPNVKRVPPSPQHPAGYAPVCVGTTTSARMERFTRPFLAMGARILIGKGGLGKGSLDAFAELGGAYLAIIGGTAALETTWIESTSTTSTRNRSGSSGCTDSARSSSPWTATARAFTTRCSKRRAAGGRKLWRAWVSNRPSRKGRGPRVPDSGEMG
jgi:L(+)-tartrate dehydratase beta subunit